MFNEQPSNVSFVFTFWLYQELGGQSLKRQRKTALVWPGLKHEVF